MEKIATQLGVYQDISHASYTLRPARLFRCVCVCVARVNVQICRRRSGGDRTGNTSWRSAPRMKRCWPTLMNRDEDGEQMGTEGNMRHL